MSHTFNPPPSTFRWWNYYVEVKWFDEGGAIQTHQMDYWGGIDGTQGDQDVPFQDWQAELLSSGFGYPGNEVETVSPVRVFSVTGFKDSAEFDTSPH